VFGNIKHGRKINSVYLLQVTTRSRRTIDADHNIVNVLVHSSVNGLHLVVLAVLRPDPIIIIITRCSYAILLSLFHNVYTQLLVGSQDKLRRIASKRSGIVWINEQNLEDSGTAGPERENISQVNRMM